MNDFDLADAQDITAGAAHDSGQSSLPLLNDQEHGEGTLNSAFSSSQNLTPASYDTSLPEGFECNNELLSEFTTLAAQNSISPAAARKLLDLQIRNEQTKVERFMETTNAWRSEIEADAEFGGARMNATIRDAQAALKAYGKSGSLIRELTMGGYGNHPNTLRFLARVGRAIRSEDNVHTGRWGSSRNTPVRDRLWPDE